MHFVYFLLVKQPYKQPPFLFWSVDCLIFFFFSTVIQAIQISTEQKYTVASWYIWHICISQLTGNEQRCCSLKRLLKVLVIAPLIRGLAVALNRLFLPDRRASQQVWDASLPPPERQLHSSAGPWADRGGEPAHGPGVRPSASGMISWCSGSVQNSHPIKEHIDEMAMRWHWDSRQPNQSEPIQTV